MKCSWKYREQCLTRYVLYHDTDLVQLTLEALAPTSLLLVSDSNKKIIGSTAVAGGFFLPSHLCHSLKKPHLFYRIVYFLQADIEKEAPTLFKMLLLSR